MRIYHLFIGCAIALLLQSCDKNDPFPDVEDEHVRKKVEVFLEGNQDEIYPWVRFSANTYTDRPLYVVQGNDTTACADGSFDLGRGEFPKSGRLVLCADGTKHDFMYVVVTYRKRKKTEPPVESELLTVRIKGYADDVQTLDTTRIMPAYYAKEKIVYDNYTFKIIF